MAFVVPTASNICHKS